MNVIIYTNKDLPVTEGCYQLFRHRFLNIGGFYGTARFAAASGSVVTGIVAGLGRAGRPLMNASVLLKLINTFDFYGLWSLYKGYSVRAKFV